ncbi:tail assembly protein [Azospirillum canadense]|uniref:hypothetical protein n=1 Tax=Azospirillum canadense TaxID=403962 RepID=UPI0022262A7D|nr:hypothetical protein [Azospirillum canadense]MCW2242272.1 putative phage tail protein [Azospirillum canadense]
MTTIVLHGRLRREFGGPFVLQVCSAAEAARMLIAQVPGFRAALREGYYRIVYGPKAAVKRGRTMGGYEIGESDLTLRTGAEAIHFVPVAAGAGRGAGKTILGAVIAVVAVVAAVYTGGASLSALGGSIAGTGITYGSVALFGISMMVGGISQMLSPMPKAPNATETDKTNSYLLGGQLNIYEQGGPVPLVYGRYRVGTTLVSAGLDTAIIMGGGPVGTPAEGGSAGGDSLPTMETPGPVDTDRPTYGPIVLKPSASVVTGFRLYSISNGTLTKADGSQVAAGEVLTLDQGAAGLTFTGAGTVVDGYWPRPPRFTVQQMAGGSPYGGEATFGSTGSFISSSDGSVGGGSAVGAPDNDGGPGHSGGMW